MHVKIIYLDGVEKVIEIPDHLKDTAEFLTSAYDQMANVTVKRDYHSKSELPVFNEIQESKD